ncbi:derlin-3 isoform X1 [Pongo abelii]|uniref:derlin-3 isoform X1 n=1 Tax=Pongo abelii TaxID=9601 RepID=UPI0023E8B37B|nr:derlin-3 isoform X1 [Pongo abelii]
MRRFNGVAGTSGRVPAGAGGDAGLHRSLRPHHRRGGKRPGGPDVALVTASGGRGEGRHGYGVAPGQLLTGPWFHSSWSSSAPFNSTSTRTLCSGSSRSGGSSPTSSSSGPWDSASSSTCSSSAGTPGQPVLPGPGPHGHAGVRVEPSQPSGEGQLLRPAHFPGTVPALGAHGLLAAAGQLHPRGPAGDCRGPHLLLPGGRLPQPAWRQEAPADPWLPVSVESPPSLSPPSEGSPPMGTCVGLCSTRAPPHRKLLLDAPAEDPNYLPLPEEQPGPHLPPPQQ